MCSKILTIAIPTFDRLQPLRRTLELLSSQGDSRVSVLILDNASPDIIGAEVLSGLNGSGFGDVKLIRNRFNVGLAGNLLRCFESCDTPWVLLLGDDDLPHERLVETSLLEVQHYQDSEFHQINFSSNICSREEKSLAVGIEQFVQLLDSFPNLNYISTNIYRTEVFCAHLRTGYHFAGTLTPHTAMTLSVVGSGGGVVFSDHRIVTCPSQELNSNSWSWLQLCLAQPLLLEHPALNDQTRRCLSLKLRAYGKVHEKNVAALLLHAQSVSGRSEAPFLYALFYQRWYGFPVNVWEFVKSIFYRSLFVAPVVSFAVLILTLRVLGRGAKADEYMRRIDRFQRI